MTAILRCARTAVSLALAAAVLACGSEEVAPPAPEILAVTLRQAEPTRLVVGWETDVPSSGELRWGTDASNLDRVLPVAAITPLHRVSLDSLTPGETYFYSILARSPRNVESVGDTLEATTPLEAAPELEARPVSGGYDAAYIRTELGEIVIKLLEDEAPAHVENFKKHLRDGYYNGTTFHRIMPGFMIQGGSPTSKDEDLHNDMRGGPGYTLEAENLGEIDEGAVCAARMTGRANPTKRSHGSQFFITVAPQPQLKGDYSIFGQVIRGMDVVHRIARLDRDMRENRPYQPVFMEIRLRHIGPNEEP